MIRFADNPFIHIVPRESEELIDRLALLSALINSTREILESGGILVLQGEPGSGKTLLISKVKKEFGKKTRIKELILTKGLINELRGVEKNELVIIDKFELCEGFKKEELRGLLEKIVSLSNEGVSFLIKITPNALTKCEKASGDFKERIKVYSMPRLSLEQGVELVKARLNEVRRKRMDSLHPFTKAELRKLWERADGNPRMLLMLCAMLYDQKTSAQKVS